MTNIDPTNPQAVLQTKANLLSQVVNQFIVRPTGNPNLGGVSGFIFDIISSERVQLNSDITDHYVEDNISVQDHIALRPEHFTLRGYVGELNDVLERALISAVTTTQRLSIVNSFIPTFTTQALQLYSQVADVAARVKQGINQAQNLYDLFTQKSTNATKQQRGYNYFKSIWISRQLLTVETPWEIFEDMAIESVSSEQDETTNMVTNFSVTFKRIRTTKTLVSFDLSKVADGRAADMVAQIANKGITKGQEASISVLQKVFS